MPLLNEQAAIGLLVNPDIDTKDEQGATIIRRRWAKNYEEYKDKFDHTKYPDGIIDENGFIHLPWTDEMKPYDLILMTLLMPNNH
jgi:hypothetical protein